MNNFFVPQKLGKEPVGSKAGGITFLEWTLPTKASTMFHESKNRNNRSETLEPSSKAIVTY